MPRKSSTATAPEQTEATPAQTPVSTQDRRTVTGKGDHDPGNPISNATGEYIGPTE